VSELRVPTVAQEAEVLCADGRTFHGRIFVPASASHHSGPVRPVDWLNDEDALFFPFLLDGEKAPVLLNKKEVLVLTVDAALEPLPAGDDAPMPRRNVVIELREHSITGVLRIDMPSHQSRVVDYLNRPGAFLVVEEAGRHHLIRKARITRVLEPRNS